MSRRLLFAPLLLVGACYGYYPVTAPSPLGREMQLNLTDSGAVALSRQIGPAAQAVEGRVTGETGNALIVSLSSVTLRDGTDTPYAGERLTVARPLIASMAERKFSRARTILLGGATALALVATREAFRGTGAGSGGSGLPGGGVGK